MKKISELLKFKEQSLASRVFFYYESSSEKWAVEYSFEMPNRFYLCADYLDDVRYYADKKTAITQAEIISKKLGATYTGRAWDMEID